MSYSVQSGETGATSSVSTVSSASASFYSRDRLEKKWWYAANWSAAFCDSVEERFACGEDKWANEFDDETLLTGADTITVIEEVPSKDLIEKKVEKENKVEEKPKKVEKKTKSPSLFAEYHNSKTIKKEENTVQKKEEEILNQFIQGNHRGWGKPTSQTRKKKTVRDFARNEILVSDGSTFDSQSLEYASTYDSTFASSSDSSYPDDEAESSGDELPKASTSSMKIVGYDSRLSYSSADNHSGRSGRTSRVSDASRNDSKRNHVRDSGDHRRTPDLERESPSFGSRGSSQHRYLKKPTRSFETQPTVSSGYSSQSSTMAKSSFVTPQKMLSTYQSPSKTTSSSTTTKTSTTTRPKSSKAAVGSHTMSLAQGMDKKIALGRNRATSRLIKEQAKAKPKAFPYMVNHTLFHQNLESKKARAMGRQRAGE